MAENILSPDPAIVELTRGDMVESRHRCHAVVVDGAGNVLHSWGDPDLVIYPRSAIKPLQTLALIETGAADHWRLTDERIALACASHSASAAHVMAVEAWLDELGLDEQALECGAQMPMDDMACRSLIRQGDLPTRLHNNCSGKHTGFLATALFLNEDTSGYTAAGHPVQKRLLNILMAMGDVDLTGAARGIDGCGIPVYGMPLVALARAMARMAAPGLADLGAVRTLAAERIVSSMAKHNFMVSGRGRLDHAAMTAGINVAKRRGTPVFATKTGAEAVHTAILPGSGLGVAVKAEDGAKRASDVLMANLLAFLDALDEGGRAELAPFLEIPVFNAAGEPVGAVRPQEGWNRP